MVTRRTVLKKGGCLALASTVPLFIRSARAQSATFDYYISVTGSNSNAGTLASPWAITALSTPANQARYAGKRVGILPGNYAVGAYAQMPSSGVPDYPCISIQGSTSSSSPTYVGSSNASGSYSPRLCVIDAHSVINPISAISLGATTTVTVNSSGGRNPYTSGQIVAINLAQGTTQINGLWLTVGTLGGSSGAWTFTVNVGATGAALNSSGFGAYAGGGYASQGYPTLESAAIGNGYSSPGVSNYGNITLDGLIVTGSYQWGIAFSYFGKGGGEGGPTGVTVQNCEIWDISGYENDNVGGVMFWQLTGATLHNSKIHQVIPTSGNLAAQDNAGIYSYACLSNIYEYNTIYATTVGIYDKNAPNGNHTYRYNYIEQTTNAASAAAGPYALYCMNDCAGGNSGDVKVCHHNILIAPDIWQGSNPSHDPALEGLTFYNNTCYYGGGGFNSGGLWFPATGAGASTVTAYNNIFYCNGNPNYQGFINFQLGSIAVNDYNAFSSSGAFFGLAIPSNPWAPTLYTLPTWQGLGFDKHSVSGTPSFASPTSLNPGGYQLNAGSIGKGTGSTTGTTSGTSCDMGAWGYDPALGGPPTQIGCNFSSSSGPVPQPPVILSVS
jgi:hypothetical protein